jgi:cytochrome b561
MALRNTTQRWGVVAQTFHWVIVALLIVQVTLAERADELTGIRKLGVLAYHKAFGITILGLVVLRLLWRSVNTHPALPDDLKPYERRLARFSHAALYLLLFAIPLSGWMMSSARGFPVSWFGFWFPARWSRFFQLPDLVPKNHSLYEALVMTHVTLVCVLAAVVALHLAGALQHHFIRRDDVLRRMLPFTRH